MLVSAAVDPVLALAIVVAFAFTVETAIGFGGMVITLALGALFAPIDVILPRVVPLNVCLSLVLVARHGRHADLPYLRRRLLPAVLLGMPVGLLAFERLDRALLTFAFGIFVLGLALAEIARMRAAEEVHPPLSAPARVLCFFLGGVMQGAFSTGGPMLVYVAARELPHKARFRATLVVAWVIFGCILLGTYVVSGRTNAHTLRDTLRLAIPLGLGLVAGEWAHTRIDERAFRKVVYAGLLCAAVVSIVRSLVA